MVEHGCDMEGRKPALNMLVIGKGVVEWVAAQTSEFNCFGTDVGIGWAKRKAPHIYPNYGYEIMKDGMPSDFKLVAGVAYANWNGPNVECHIASDGSRKWLTRQYLSVIFDYPYNQLGVDRITVCVGEGNAESNRFVKHLGFVLESSLAGAHPTGKLHIYRLWRHECRFLQVRHEKLAA